MYILGPKKDVFESDTVYTPNIRTEFDESYLKGHPLENGKKGMVVHYTAEDGDISEITERFMDRNSGVSSHVVIAPDGKRRVFATPDKITFHSGESMFNNVSNVNDFMIGVEFQNLGTEPLTKEQVDSFVEYAKPIIFANNIPLENIVTHENVRTQYKEYLKRNGKTEEAKAIPDKMDLTYDQYK